MRLKDQTFGYEDWARKVQDTELKYALKQLAAGQDINTVMEAMSHRIQKKMLHPVLLAIKEMNTSEFDPVKSREEYNRIYGNLPKPADHVSQDY